MPNEYGQCTAVREEFSALLDGELGPDERDRVESHLALCSDCLRELDGLKKVDTLFRRLPPVEAPSVVEARIRHALRPTVLGKLRPHAKIIWPAMAAGLLLTAAGTLTWHYGIRTQPLGDYEHMAALELSPEAARSLPAAAPEAAVTATAGELAAVVSAENPVASPPLGNAIPAEQEADAALPTAAPEQETAPLADGFAAREVVADSAANQASLESSTGAKEEAGAALPTAPAPSALRSRGDDAPTAVERQGLSEKRDNALKKSVSLSRTFTEANGTWYESGYRGEPLTPIERDSETFRTLIASDPHLRDALALHERAIFRVGGEWYQVGLTRPAQSGTSH